MGPKEEEEEGDAVDWIGLDWIRRQMFGRHPPSFKIKKF